MGVAGEILLIEHEALAIRSPFHCYSTDLVFRLSDENLIVVLASGRDGRRDGVEGNDGMG